ncbi:DUF2865 domain-containing protein [Pararhizobium sp. YC-54]|uniref:DUF2865 domain-containing protein n=1 Tax=Pararhizobium sp. YC-54 TaxID=2986920 RepID=UPI0021F6B601|nr:DUF2865 domain-containing protein [Pararhizobium sp. YC-54]MCV9996829.1 DUF2865 domain-containing protein [Pararhizobium sp. YC-54]
MTATADASAVCERLNARLASLPKIVASNANLRDYTGAISRQNLDLRQARSDLRRMGCSSDSVLIVGGPNEGACESLAGEISQMEMDLQTLKARRQTLVTGSGSEIARRRILAALDVNRCFEEQDEVVSAAVEEPETHRNILKDLPPIGEDYLDMRDSNDVSDFTTPDDGFAPSDDYPGSLRTLCVRTCDGAFFPISSDASPADFPRDAEACQRRCPGTETALYYHALATEETDQMVSAATGEPYADLPSAFAYKTRDLSEPGQCGCSPVGRTATQQSTPHNGKGVIEFRTSKKAAPAEVKSVIADRPYNPQDSKVRVVGPSFLPSQETSIDLRHPAGPGYQQQQTN